MKKIILLCAVFFAALFFARAGDQPLNPPRDFASLKDHVKRANLVLRCREVTVQGKKRWRIEEVLKGEYRKEFFDFISPFYNGGNTLASPSYHVTQPKHSEEIRFVRVAAGWHKEYTLDEAFPVIDGKIVYPKIIDWAHRPIVIDREFTLAEFLKAIKTIEKGADE